MGHSAAAWHQTLTAPGPWVTLLGEVPINAQRRRASPNIDGGLNGLRKHAVPLLLRGRVIDAVLAAQTRVGGPVTSQQARSESPDGVPLLPSARAFTDVAAGVVRLGPDARGRVLVAVDPDRKGFARWWVEERRARD